MTFIVGFLTSFATWLGHFFVKGAKNIASFLLLLSANALLISIFILFIGSIITLFLWIFNTINTLLSYLDKSHSDNLLSLSFNVLKSLGIWDGFVDAFNIISVGIIALLVVMISKVTLKVLFYFRDTIYMFIMSLLKD